MNEVAYLVTTGDYTDYSVCGVFLTKEAAQAKIDELLARRSECDTFANRRQYHGSINDIEEIPLNDIVINHSGYVVCLNTVDGSIISCELRNVSEPYFGHRSQTKGVSVITITAYAKSLESAKRLAWEYRNKYLAANPGFTFSGYNYINNHVNYDVLYPVLDKLNRFLCQE